MGKYSRGVTLVNVQTGAMVLLFAFTISLLSSNNSSALAVDPILDSIIAVTRLDQPENPEAKTGRGNTNKNKSQTTTQTSSSRFAPQASGTSQYIPVITEPLTELPTIDASDIQQQPVRMPRPDSAIVTASAVLGVKTNGSIAPLQASNEGWKLFGVAWYWWLLGGGVIYYATRQLINLQHRRTATQSSMVS